MKDEWKHAHWFKATDSGDHGCVEVAFRDAFHTGTRFADGLHGRVECGAIPWR